MADPFLTGVKLNTQRRIIKSILKRGSRLEASEGVRDVIYGNGTLGTYSISYRLWDSRSKPTRRVIDRYRELTG